MSEEFELKPEHIKLIARMGVGWQECETGAPEIDPKRPYGNSYVAGDVAEILGWQSSGEDEDGDPALSEEQQEEALRIHAETETALQIVLCCQTFEPGRFVKTEKYRRRSWKRVVAA